MVKRSLMLGILALLIAFQGQSLATLYPKVGVLCCGDLWDTFAPSGIYKDYTSSDVNIMANWQLIRMGNLERSWLTPTQMYPGGDIFHLPWSQQFVMVEYSNIPNFNNYTTSTDERAKKYVYAFTMPKTKGVPVSSNGDNRGAAPWMDADRTGQLYTATMPTNIGVNVKMRARSYTLNEANMNDWIAVELELTNTGIQDINCDGIIDREGHVIEALSICVRNEVVGNMPTGTGGGRWGHSFQPGRLSGYDGSPDPEGNPWDATCIFTTGIDQAIVDANGWAPDNERKIGYAWGSGHKLLWDVWSGNSFIAVKQGPMEGGPTAPDKKTIYDSHPIGTGKQRGWFASSNRSWGNAGRNPWEDFIASTGTFYEDGGKTWSTSAIKPIKPDPNWFDTTKPYTPDDPLSFVSIVKPEGQRGQPMGDMKYLRKWLQNWERNYPGTNPPIPPEDTWTDGGTTPVRHNFDGDKLVGVGPFRLEVGETITVVWVQYAGHRLKGLRQSLKAARWAYENNWNIPKPPPMPDLKVSPIQIATGFNNKVVWDNRAESAPDFAGYKIYRVSAYPKVDYRKLGIQFLSNYHHQGPADIGATDDQLVAKYCDKNNPNWSAPADYVEMWDGNPSGPWRIVAYIPKDQLANYANTGDDKATYPYAWIDEDKSIQIGYTYWYYVAAFDNESGTMAGVKYTSLESSKDNWNGRDGRWYGTYHFATANAEYPTYSLADQKFIGAAFVLKPARVTKADLLSGVKRIEVRPNPYKVQAPHDVGLEHKVQFFNLTADTRITIFDLSGQIIDVLEYEGQDPRDGSIFWDMFTKDGPEVASGLYIWVAEYPGGRQHGYLAIER